MRAPKGALTKAVVNAVIANPYSKAIEIADLLAVDKRGVFNVLSKMYRQGTLGRKKCRYYLKKTPSAPVAKPKQLELELPVAQERPVVETPTHSDQINALRNEVHDLQVKLLDQAAVIKYLEQRLGVTRG